MGQRELKFTIEAAIRDAHGRKHEYVTVEHLLFALLFDEEARSIILHCGGDVSVLIEELGQHLETKVPRLPPESSDYPVQSLGFQRVLERAVLQVRSSGRGEIGVSDVLVAIYHEPESQAVHLLEKQGITRLDMLEYISHGDPPARAAVERLAGRPADELRILVSHRPDAAFDLDPGDVDLVVSGHTHGGQVALPLIGPPIKLSNVSREVAAGGLHDIDGVPVYLSTGVGLERATAPQVRFGARPSIGLLTLE